MTTLKMKTNIQEKKTEHVDQIEHERLLKPTFKERMNILIQDNLNHIVTLKKRVYELRKLQKEHDFSIKNASKKHKKKQKKWVKARRPTGFAAPNIISDQFSTFLIKTNAIMKDPAFVPSSREEEKNWPRIPVVKGALIAQTDVTSHLNKYIRDKKLQNSENKREILPDKTLQELLSPPTVISKSDNITKVYTYTQLQKCTSHHFTKPVKIIDF